MINRLLPSSSPPSTVVLRWPFQEKKPLFESFLVSPFDSLLSFPRINFKIVDLDFRSRFFQLSFFSFFFGFFLTWFLFYFTCRVLWPWSFCFFFFFVFASWRCGILRELFGFYVFWFFLYESCVCFEVFDDDVDMWSFFFLQGPFFSIPQSVESLGIYRGYWRFWVCRWWPIGLRVTMTMLGGMWSIS